MNDYFLNCYAARLSEPYVSDQPEDIQCPLDHDLLDSLCPVNIETGLRDDPLVRVNDPNISDSERQALLASLPKFNSPKGDNVDDETKLMFTKLRSIQTPSELQAFKASIQTWLDSQDQDQDQDQNNDQDQDQNNDQDQDQNNDQ